MLPWLRLKPTPAPVTPLTLRPKVWALVLRFVIVTLLVRDWPEPAGTEPKLVLTGSTAATAVTAPSRSRSPAPTTLTSVTTAPLTKDVTAPCTAVFTTAERTCAALHVGCAPRTTAAAPARCGVDIEVPFKNAQQMGSPSQ